MHTDCLRCWYFLGLFIKISDKHLRQFYLGIPPLFYWLFKWPGSDYRTIRLLQLTERQTFWYEEPGSAVRTSRSIQAVSCFLVISRLQNSRFFCKIVKSLSWTCKALIVEEWRAERTPRLTSHPSHSRLWHSLQTSRFKTHCRPHAFAKNTTCFAVD